MTVKSVPCYYVECDNCGQWSTDGGEYAVWSDQASAEEEALAVGWKPLTYGRWLCEECPDEDGADPAGGDAVSDPIEHTTDELLDMVVLRRHPDGTPAVWCDPDVADIVAALNAGGVPTVASCSGHGMRPGNVALTDGRELIVAADWHEAREVEAAFPPLNPPEGTP